LLDPYVQIAYEILHFLSPRIKRPERDGDHSPPSDI
jgi:hypothetical protein